MTHESDTPDPDDGVTFRRKLLSGFAWQGSTKAFVQTASWVSTIVVARFLLPSDYGIVAISGVFTELLAMVVEMGLVYGLIQKARTTPEEEDAVFYFGLAVSAGAYAALYAAAPLIAGFYDNPILVTVLRVAGLGLVIGSIKGVPLAIAMRRMDFRYRSLVEMGARLTAAVTVVTMAVTGFGLWSLVFAFLASQLVGAVAFLPAFGRIPRPRFTFAPIAGILGYGLKILTNNLLYFVYSRADITIIGKVLGEQLLGYYNMAFQLATIPLDKIGAIFNQVTFPAMSRLQDDPEGSRKLFLDLHRHLLIITYPILLGLAAVADDLIVLLLTEKWRSIVPVLQALCVVNLLRMSGMIFSPVLNGRGKAGTVLNYAVASTVILPVAFLIGSRYGLMGVIVAWAVAYPPLYLILLVSCLRDLGISAGEFLRSTVPAVVASAIMTAAVVSVRQLGQDLDPWLRLALMIAAGPVVYLGVFLLLFRDQLRQVRKGIAMLRNRTV